MAKELKPPSADNDRNLEPAFCVVYVVDNPIGGLRAARTHARTFETFDDVIDFLHWQEVGEADLIGVWKLGKKTELQRSTKKVREARTVHQWAKPEGAK